MRLIQIFNSCFFNSRQILHKNLITMITVCIPDYQSGDDSAKNADTGSLDMFCTIKLPDQITSICMFQIIPDNIRGFAELFFQIRKIRIFLRKVIF